MALATELSAPTATPAFAWLRRVGWLERIGLAGVLVITLVGLDIMMSLWKQKSDRVAKILDGVPILVIENGKVHQDRMQKERVDESDILAAAREKQGLERMDQIKHAIVEASGGITIVPKKS